MVLASARLSALPVTLPSPEVDMKPAANNGASMSGLLAFIACSHFSSSAATAFSIPSAAGLPCGHAALPIANSPNKHQIEILFISSLHWPQDATLRSRGPLPGHLPGGALICPSGDKGGI